MTKDSTPRIITSLDQLIDLGMPKEEAEKLGPVVKRYGIRIPRFYAKRIDFSNPKDPLFKLVIPDVRKLGSEAEFDPSNEKAHLKAPGLEHKYTDTALLLTTALCVGNCSYCFRASMVTDTEDSGDSYVSPVTDPTRAVKHISEHPEIRNVLLSGGDPLTLSTRRLEQKFIGPLSEIPHVKVIRIGTKGLSYNPHRVLDDEAFVEMVGKYSTPDQAINFMLHFTHPAELSYEAKQAGHLLKRAGAKLNNQTPIIRGINDNPAILHTLFRELEASSINPYYVFQCRPAHGNDPYILPVEKAFEIFDQSRRGLAGVAKTARFMMSHATGKVHVLGMDEQRIYMRYHRAANPENDGRFISFERNPTATWFDDYLQVKR